MHAALSVLEGANPYLKDYLLFDLFQPELFQNQARNVLSLCHEVDREIFFAMCSRRRQACSFWLLVASMMEIFYTSLYHLTTNDYIK